MKLKRFIKNTFSLLTVGLLFCNAPVLSFTLNEAIQSGVNNNPNLESAYQMWKSSESNIKVKSSLPDPMLSVTKFTEKIQTRTGEQSSAFKFSQKFPFPGVLSTKKRQARSLARVSEKKYEMEVRNLIVAIKQNYADAWFFYTAKGIAASNTILISGLSTESNRDNGQKWGTIQDDLRTESIRSQASYDEQTYQELFVSAKARLQSLIVNDISGKMTLPPVPTFPDTAEVLVTKALNNRLEISSAKNYVSASKEGVKLAHLASKPNFTLGFGISQMGSRPDNPAIRPAGEGKDPRYFSIAMNLPVWWGKNRARNNAARARLKAAVANIKNIELLTKAKVIEIWVLGRNRLRTWLLYRDSLIPQARKALERAEILYRAKEAALTEVLESQSNLYMLVVAAAKARADVCKAGASLEGLVGVPLEYETGEEK